MINYVDDVKNIFSGFADVTNIQIIDRLHYSKYAFVISTSFKKFDEYINRYSKNYVGSHGILSIAKWSSDLCNDILGPDWRKYNNLHHLQVNKKFEPENYDKFLDTVEKFRNVKINKSITNDFGIFNKLVSIKMPRNSDHLQTLIDLQNKTDSTLSFLNVKYIQLKPKDDEYPVKSRVSFSGKGLSKDDKSFILETINNTDGIFMKSKSLAISLNSNYPSSTTIYAKSIDCFGHFVFLLKPYNIKFLSTEVYNEL